MRSPHDAMGHGGHAAIGEQLLRLAEETFARFQARNGEEELQFGMFRVAISTYSETAFREALANTLIHRDYTQRGAVHVQWSEE